MTTFEAVCLSAAALAALFAAFELGAGRERSRTGRVIHNILAAEFESLAESHDGGDVPAEYVLAVARQFAECDLRGCSYAIRKTRRS